MPYKEYKIKNCKKTETSKKSNQGNQTLIKEVNSKIKIIFYLKNARLLFK